jgi:hypothetical protein
MKTSEFLSIFPEFEAAAVDRIGFFLENAQSAISERRFGKQTEYARALYAAHHLIVLGGFTGADGSQSVAQIQGGAVASKSVGSASVSYDTGALNETDAGYWNATAYGRLLWILMRQYRRMPFVAVGRAVCP